MPSSVFAAGFAVCATLIIAIGAQNAFVLRQGLRQEHVLPIVAFCALTDLTLIAAGVAGLAKVLGDAPRLALGLTIFGGLFLLWYGAQALRRALRPESLRAAGDGGGMPLRAAIGQVAAFTFLNPHVYLDTVLLMGSIGARQPFGLRWWFVGGAAAASGTWFTALGFGARFLTPFFSRPRAWQILDTLIGLTMIALAAGLISQGHALAPRVAP
jgi:L-lysine exporter family protein LysE/ArgO